MFADVEHKSRGTVDRFGAENSPASTNRFNAVIPGTGLAAHGQRCTVRQFETAGHPFGGTGVHHLGQGLAHGRGDFGRHHSFADVRVVDQLRFIRCVGGKVQAVDAQGWHPHAIVENGADQFG